MNLPVRRSNQDSGHFEPGVIFLRDRNKLYRFTTHGVSVLRLWPKPRAWARDGQKAWRGVHPRVDLRVADPARYGHGHAGNPGPERAAFTAVPPAVRDQVLTGSFRDRQWMALQLAASAPEGAAHLQVDVPLLAAALADANTVRAFFGRPGVRQPWRSARALLRPGPGWTTWRKVAAWLGLPDDKAFIGLLRRIGDLGCAPERPGWDLADLLDLAQAWTVTVGRKRLLHGPPPQPWQARLLGLLAEGQVPQLLSCALYAETWRAPQAESLHAICLDIIAIRRCLQITSPAPTLATEAQVERLRGRLIRAMDAAMGGMGDFPAPPLPSQHGIEAIESERGLIEIGQRMGHCLGRGDWALLCRARRGYAYEVHGKHHETGEHTEATAWIVPTPGAPEQFRLEQIKGPHNEEAMPGLVWTVHQWLNTHNQVVLARQQGRRLPPALQGWPATPVDWSADADGSAIAALLRMRSTLGAGRRAPPAPADELQPD